MVDFNKALCIYKTLTLDLGRDLFDTYGYPIICDREPKTAGELISKGYVDEKIKNYIKEVGRIGEQLKDAIPRLEHEITENVKKVIDELEKREKQKPAPSIPLTAGNKILREIVYVGSSKRKDNNTFETIKQMISDDNDTIFPITSMYSSVHLINYGVKMTFYNKKDQKFTEISNFKTPFEIIIKGIDNETHTFLVHQGKSVKNTKFSNRKRIKPSFINDIKFFPTNLADCLPNYVDDPKSPATKHDSALIDRIGVIISFIVEAEVSGI